MADAKVFLTVDVEAQPRRAVGDPVDDLIFGRFGDKEFGIGRMMDIADAHNAKMSFFLDLAEYDLYGERILDVGRLIIDRGHDLQVHIHPEFISRDFFAERGVPRIVNFFEMPNEVAKHVSEYICGLYSRVSSAAPKAFRGGGYRYGPEILGCLSEYGIQVASNYNYGRNSDYLNLGTQSVFKWNTGTLELPVTCTTGLGNLDRIIEYNFNSAIFNREDWSREMFVQRHVNFIDAATSSNELRGGTPVVLVMHSWSFLNKNTDGRFGSPSSFLADRFSDLLGVMAERAKFATMKDAVDLYYGDPSVKAFDLPRLEG